MAYKFGIHPGTGEEDQEVEITQMQQAGRSDVADEFNFHSSDGCGKYNLFIWANWFKRGPL